MLDVVAGLQHGGDSLSIVGKRTMLFSLPLPPEAPISPSFSHPGGVKNKWIYRQHTSITVAGNEKKDRDGIGVFRHTHTHVYTHEDRSFLSAPKRTIRLLSA